MDVQRHFKQSVHWAIPKWTTYKFSTTAIYVSQQDLLRSHVELSYQLEWIVCNCLNTRCSTNRHYSTRPQNLEVCPKLKRHNSQYMLPNTKLIDDQQLVIFLNFGKKNGPLKLSNEVSIHDITILNNSWSIPKRGGVITPNVIPVFLEFVLDLM